MFGAYTDCSWPAADGTVAADPSGKSFIFSLTNADDKAVRFSLKDKERAIELEVSSVRFGAIEMEGDEQTGWPNFAIMDNDLAADHKDANLANSINVTQAYQPDDGRVCDSTFLAGQFLFAAAEIEVFQL